MNEDPHSVTRRLFLKIAGAGAAGAAALPAFGQAAPKRIVPPMALPSRPVRLSANENPYGPSPAALRAMTEAFPLASRYPDEEADRTAQLIASQHGVSPEQVLLGNGSSEILKVAASAFTEGRAVVTADPTFEALGRHARTAGGEVIRIPLTSDFSHDLARMAQISASLIYVCNPNNPTASITPKDDLRSFLAAIPDRTVVLVDEAYHHYVETPAYESVIPLVKKTRNLVVTRTFSKIYGMAGLRLGYAIAHPDLIERMRLHQAWDTLNVMALVAGRASLGDAAQVTEGRRTNSEVRAWLSSELQILGYRTIPSHANFVMVSMGRDVRPLIDALRQRRVEVGRYFPALPNHLRVTIGTRQEMKAFLSAFRQAMAAGS